MKVYRNNINKQDQFENYLVVGKELWVLYIRKASQE